MSEENPPSLQDYQLMVINEVCHWDGAELLALEYYSHDGGLPVKGFPEKQWLYAKCTKCHVTLHGNPSANVGVEGHITKKVSKRKWRISPMTNDRLTLINATEWDFCPWCGAQLTVIQDPMMVIRRDGGIVNDGSIDVEATEATGFSFDVPIKRCGFHIILWQARSNYEVIAE